MLHSSSLGSRYKSTSSETKCFFWNTLNLITFQQVTEEIELSPCKWVLPRLWLHSSQSVSWFQGRNLGSWRVFYDQSQLNWNRKPTANKNQNNNKKSKQEMLLVWQSYGLVYSRMQWTMQTLIFLDFFFWYSQLRLAGIWISWALLSFSLTVAVLLCQDIFGNFAVSIENK